MPTKPMPPETATAAPTAPATATIADPLERCDRHAEMAGLRLAEHQRVEIACEPDERAESAASDDRASATATFCPGRAGEAAELPEGQLAQLPVVAR